MSKPPTRSRRRLLCAASLCVCACVCSLCVSTFCRLGTAVAAGLLKPTCIFLLHACAPIIGVLVIINQVKLVNRCVPTRQKHVKPHAAFVFLTLLLCWLSPFCCCKTGVDSFCFFRQAKVCRYEAPETQSGTKTAVKNSLLTGRNFEQD